MKKNVSNKERIARLLIAMVFTALNISGIVSGAESILLWVVIAILVVTGVLGNCPAYSLFGINTHTRKKEIKKYS